MMDIISGLIDIYVAIIIIRTVISWVKPDPDIRSVHILYQMTDPYLNRIKKILPLYGSIDLSPAVGVIVLLLIKKVLAYIF